MPSAARGVFGSELDAAVRYAELLATVGVERGLIGPREAPRLWDRHLLNCAVLGEAVPAGARVCDIGSGAGLPGLVLAIARPDVLVTLVEPLLRRTTFLDEVVAELRLDVLVVRGRAEDHAPAEPYDVVTARAVAPLERLIGWGMPLVGATGALVAMKGAAAETEIAEAAEVVREWDLADPVVVELGAGRITEPTRAVRIAWADPSSVSWPAARRSVAGPSGPRSDQQFPTRKRRPRRGR